jgi:two-component system, response regulator, stage 0 sporulation protein A
VEKLEIATIKVLRELEIPAHIIGYLFIKDAVGFISEDQTLLQCLTVQMGLYSQIALKWNTTPARVERGIRHAIKCSEADADTTKHILGTSKHMCNGAFLGALVEYLRMGATE